jgi:putative transposase
MLPAYQLTHIQFKDYFMISFLLFPVRFLYFLFTSKVALALRMALFQKEIDILKRKKGNKKLFFSFLDKLYFLFLHYFSNVRDHITIVKPETLLSWQRLLIKHFWTFRSAKKAGRPSTPVDIKNLILQIKNDNIFWRIKRIQGELLKLGISLDKKTIRNIIRDFRKKGKIIKSLTWKKFLTMHSQSIFSMDNFTIDTLTNVRYYVHFIIHHETRRIIQFAITTNPVREFVRQQIIQFSENINKASFPSVFLIHDRAREFDFDYRCFDIRNIKTSVKSPNMNIFAERFIGSVRREALDYFLLVSERQIKRILTEYISYYNSKRPHQGLNQEIPLGYIPQSHGSVKSQTVLGGLNHHYYREVA